MASRRIAGEYEHQRGGCFSQLSSLLTRARNILLCGSTDFYSLVKRQQPGVVSLPDSKYDPSSKFLVVLWQEGLLKDKYFVEQSKGKPPRIILLYDAPVLAICTGFTNCELGRKPSRSLPVPRPMCDGTCRIQYGLNRVLTSRPEDDDEVKVDGYPASFWIDLYTSLLKNSFSWKPQSRNLSNRTKRRRNRLIPGPGYRPQIMGDNSQRLPQGVIGPMFQARQIRNNVLHVMAHRFGELGERQRHEQEMRRAIMNLPDQLHYEPIIIAERAPNRPLSWRTVTNNARQIRFNDEDSDESSVEENGLVDVENPNPFNHRRSQ